MICHIINCRVKSEEEGNARGSGSVEAFLDGKDELGFHKTSRKVGLDLPHFDLGSLCCFDLYMARDLSHIQMCKIQKVFEISP